MDRPIAVVICDDHTVMAEGLAALLGAEPDIDVVGIGGSVSELHDLALTHRPDVVLLDYQLPDGDGVTAATELKSTHPDTRVVMLTAFTSHAVLVAAMQAGCSGYLSKHSASQLVAEGIRRVASGDVLLSPDMLQQLLPRLNRPDQGPGSQLTQREREILELLATGTPTRTMAASLFISSNTLRNHVQSILNKLGAHTRLEAVSIAVREGIIRRA
jgi:DNA-binding NarL/FixJ family response regulator